MSEKTKPMPWWMIPLIPFLPVVVLVGVVAVALAMLVWLPFAASARFACRFAGWEAPAWLDARAQTSTGE